MYKFIKNKYGEKSKETSEIVRNYLIDEGFIDSEKIGIMGWSQGGYISAFVSTYSDRFKAISVGTGISDHSGTSVSINSTGTIVAIGSPFKNISGVSSGQVRIFENIV